MIFYSLGKLFIYWFFLFTCLTSVISASKKNLSCFIKSCTEKVSARRKNIISKANKIYGNNKSLIIYEYQKSGLELRWNLPILFLLHDVLTVTIYVIIIVCCKVIRQPKVLSIPKKPSRENLLLVANTDPSFYKAHISFSCPLVLKKFCFASLP
jgi:tRNA uridine 5-carbamoylmethylation protein Kti12